MLVWHFFKRMKKFTKTWGGMQRCGFFVFLSVFQIFHVNIIFLTGPENNRKDFSYLSKLNCKPI